MAHKTRELRSTVSKDGVLTLSLAEIVLDDPASDEIIVRVEAAPINPSDLGLLLGPADAASVRRDVSDGAPQLSLDIPPARMGGMAGRINQSLPVGNEGAGTVIAAGDQAKDWIGRRVGMIGGGMYADLRKIRTRDALPLPESVTAAQGAALTVNPRRRSDLSKPLGPRDIPRLSILRPHPVWVRCFNEYARKMVCRWSISCVLTIRCDY